MDKKQRMWIAIVFLSLATIGLTIAVIFLATQDDSEPEIIITTANPNPATTTVPTTTTIASTTTTIASTTTHAPGVITDDDLRSLSEELLEADENNKGKYVTVNLDADPDAGEFLLELDDDVLNCPTMKAFIDLSDNFKAPVNVDDNLGVEYINEKEEFLNSVMDTKIMKITEDWMIAQGIFEGSNLTLHDVVDHIWFQQYAGSHSSGVLDSTGFEHTFVGQINEERVLGLHNWIHFYELEQAGNVTYTDYVDQTIFDGDGVNKGSVLKFSYDWQGASKDNGTMFIGTSPELEIALYTVCYIARANVKCPVQLNGKQFTITTMDYNRLRVIAVANPNI